MQVSAFDITTFVNNYSHLGSFYSVMKRPHNGRKMEYLIRAGTNPVRNTVNATKYFFCVFEKFASDDQG